MYSNSQWPGHGQKETADIFQELVEITPQLPIGKMVKGTKAAFTKLAHTVRGSVADKKVVSSELAVSSQSV